MGVESISLVQNDKRNEYRAQDPWLVERTARSLHDNDRDRRDRCRALSGHARRAGRIRALVTAAAHRGGADCGPVRSGNARPLHRRCGVKNRDTGETSFMPVTLDKDEGNRPSTTLAVLPPSSPPTRAPPQRPRRVPLGPAPSMPAQSTAQTTPSREVPARERRRLQRRAP